MPKFIPKAAEVIHLQIGSTFLQMDRLQGGALQFGLAEYKNPQYSIDTGTGSGEVRATPPVSTYHYSDLKYGEVTLEKALLVKASFGDGTVAYSAEEIKTLREAFDAAYKARFEGGDDNLSRQRVVTASRTIYVSGTTVSAKIFYKGPLLHYVFEDASVDQENEVIRIRAVIQPTLISFRQGERTVTSDSVVEFKAPLGGKK